MQHKRWMKKEDIVRDLCLRPHPKHPGTGHSPVEYLKRQPWPARASSSSSSPSAHIFFVSLSTGQFGHRGMFRLIIAWVLYPCRQTTRWCSRFIRKKEGFGQLKHLNFGELIQAEYEQQQVFPHQFLPSYDGEMFGLTECDWSLPVFVEVNETARLGTF